MAVVTQNGYSLPCLRPGEWQVGGDDHHKKNVVDMTSNSIATPSIAVRQQGSSEQMFSEERHTIIEKLLLA